MRQGHHFPSAPRELLRSEWLMVWLVTTGICQQTRHLEGTVGGRWYRGSDYLVRRAVEHCAHVPDFWKPRALSHLLEHNLAAAFSSDGHAENSTLDRLAERTRQVRGLAIWLLRHYDGYVERLLPEDRSISVRDFCELLSETECYSDPLRKKSYLLLMTLEQTGLIRLEDPEAIELPVDYHVMRVLLRTGVLRVHDDALRARLAGEKPVSPADEEAIRRATLEAGRAMVRDGISMFHLDAALWSIGRSCCREKGRPFCQLSVTCPRKPSRCSLLDSFSYPCADHCPLSGSCATALDHGAELLHAPVVSTHFY